MAKPEWGTKRLCTSCGARFYDMNRQPIECPKCSTVIDPEQTTRLKRSRSNVAEEPTKAKSAKVATSEDDIDDDADDLVDDDADDDVLEDASDLSDDDEDFEEFVDGADPKEKDGD